MTTRREGHKKFYAEDPFYRDLTLLRRRLYRAGRKELDNARLRRRWASNPQYREKARARRYGLTWQTYQAILARQGQACAICGTAERPLCIDHCHATGKVRGLLCGPCNRGLGCYRDGPNLLRAAAAYLDENG